MKNIEKILDSHNLSHFKFYENGAKIVYTEMSGTSSHVQDYKKLVRVLNDNNIKYDAIGIDVLLIKEEK